MTPTATADSGRPATGWTPAGAGGAAWRWWRHSIVAPVRRSPAAGAYAALWLIAAAYLAARGESILGSLSFLLGTAVFNVATVALTADPPPVERPATPAVRRRVGAQLAVALLVVGITGYEALAFHRLIPRDVAFIPLWTPVTAWFGHLGSRYLSPAIVGDPYNAVFNPARYFLLLLPLLLLLGAPARAGAWSRGPHLARPRRLVRHPPRRVGVRPGHRPAAAGAAGEAAGVEQLAERLSSRSSSSVAHCSRA